MRLSACAAWPYRLWLGRQTASGRALAGQATVYPAIGGTSRERGLYFAAPVHGGNSRDTPITGAYAIKMPVADIDRLLERTGDPVLLLSPDGVVFASNRAAWLLKLAGQVSVERREDLVRGKQFGSLFDDDGPEHLHFSVDGSAPSATIPEPSSLLLSAAALGALAFHRRRRRA
eukprot:gene36643-45201_t